MPLGWAISGTGDIVNKAVAPALTALPTAELVGFHSRTPARAEAFRQRFGAPAAWGSLADLLAEERVQAVYVAGEVDRHAPETIAAAEAGRHVLVEKPMALDSAECRAMIDACRAHGVGLAVAYYRRWFPSVLALKALVDEGALGTVLQASIDMASRFDPAPDHPKRWRVEARGGGGALMDIGSHRLDVLCWLLGEPQQVAGLTARRAQPTWHAPDVETLLVSFASGAHGVLRCTWSAGANQDRLTLVGSEGLAATGDLADGRLVIRRGTADEVREVGRAASNGHEPLLADFTQRILAGEPPRHDGVDGCQASRIMDGCYRSAASGQVVDV